MRQSRAHKAAYTWPAFRLDLRTLAFRFALANQLRLLIKFSHSGLRLRP